MPQDRSRYLGRTVGTRSPKRTVLLLCEGKSTEPDYFGLIKSTDSVSETVAPTIDRRPGLPANLVDRAITASQEGGWDEVWCVFDVEAPVPHPHLAEALERAEASGINVALSNPCFELWLVLHRQDQAAWLDSAAAETLSEQLGITKKKKLIDQEIVSGLKDAEMRAAILQRKHAGDGNLVPQDNPSSSVGQLIAALRQRP